MPHPLSQAEKADILVDYYREIIPSPGDMLACLQQTSIRD
jgi:hypothetical protein